jgi:hypothetical protein
VASDFAVTVPVAVFVLAVWWISVLPAGDRVLNTVLPVGAVLVLLDPLVPVPVVLTAVVVAVMVAAVVVRTPGAAESQVAQVGPADRVDG